MSCASECEDGDWVDFQYKDAFLPSVNPSVSLVRIRSEKSLIRLQSPRRFTGEDISLHHCLHLNFSIGILFYIFLLQPASVSLFHHVTVDLTFLLAGDIAP